MSSVTAVPLLPVKRGYLVWLWLGILVALIAAAALAFAGDTGIKATPSGLRYKVIAPGKPGTHPTDADIGLVSYIGKLPDGTVFDKSQQPVPMPVAAVVPGFSEGLKLMNKGAKYRFWIPPQLGYGDKANGPIPANSTLVFDVELVDFLPEAVVRQMQAQQQMMGRAPGGMPGGAPEGVPGGAMPGGPPPAGEAPRDGRPAS
jgi:FKBP-type peptidyl-prolyl cis-trans isomerase FkpA